MSDNDDVHQVLHSEGLLRYVGWGYTNAAALSIWHVTVSYQYRPLAIIAVSPWEYHSGDECSF